jgi:hypothetical protein
MGYHDRFIPIFLALGKTNLHHSMMIKNPPKKTAKKPAKKPRYGGGLS